MDKNSQKEEFSYAYIQAVASVAGYSVQIKPRLMDNAGIDLTIEVPNQIGFMLSPKFDAQVKCTSSTKIIDHDLIKFPLPVKNYNRLIHPKVLAPQILIVVLVPENIEQWLQISETETIMKKCGYWVSLKGQPETTNTSNITVTIPRENVFSPSSLKLIMDKISRGEDL